MALRRLPHCSAPDFRQLLLQTEGPPVRVRVRGNYAARQVDVEVEGHFQNGVWGQAGKGIEWTTWNGEPSGADGYLADNFRFLQAIFLREPALRTRYYRPLDELDATSEERHPKQ